MDECQAGEFSIIVLYQGLWQNSTLNFPAPEPLPARENPVPYVVVADDAFAMKPYLMKPYPFRGQDVPNGVFNYRLSRARRIVENVFGIIANRFRILTKPIELGPEKATLHCVGSMCITQFFNVAESIKVFYG